MEGPNIENFTTEKSDFDKQWENPQSVKVFGEEKFNVYGIKPDYKKRKTEVPLVIGMGWAESPESHKNHMRNWTENGREVICPDTPHGISAGENDNYPAIEMRKVEALVETMRARGIEIKEGGVETGKVDLLGRSEGAIFSIITAYLYPHLVRNLVLENPAGLTGESTKGDFFMRWLRDTKMNVTQEFKEEYNEKNKPPQKTNSDMYEILGRNLAAAKDSVLAISTADVREMLKDIKSHGIGIAVIATTDDQLFPIERMAGRAEPEPLSVTGREKIIPELTEEYVDGFYSLRGSHISYLQSPDKFALVVDEALDGLEAKKQKQVFLRKFAENPQTAVLLEEYRKLESDENEILKTPETQESAGRIKDLRSQKEILWSQMREIIETI
jgi:pimeloyl-ACP methyl ester carboxylesterase